MRPRYRFSEDGEEPRIRYDLCHAWNSVGHVEVVRRNLPCHLVLGGGTEMAFIPGDALLVLFIEKVQFLGGGDKHFLLFLQTPVDPRRGGTLRTNANII